MVDGPMIDSTARKTQSASSLHHQEHPTIEDVAGSPDDISSHRLTTSTTARVAKRLLDLCGCALLALPLLLILPVVAIIIKIDSRGPVIFAQARVGRGGTPFRMLKFRSMHVDAEARLEADPELERIFHEHGCKLPEDLDPRITRVGRLLRRCSIDELPQVWNVLAGDMSLVGPRPIEARQVEALYGDFDHLCLQVQPGLTGAWQVSGRASVQGEERSQLDQAYVQEWSLLGDVMVLVKTIPAVFSARGAH